MCSDDAGRMNGVPIQRRGANAETRSSSTVGGGSVGVSGSSKPSDFNTTTTHSTSHGTSHSTSSHSTRPGSNSGIPSSAHTKHKTTTAASSRPAGVTSSARSSSAAASANSGGATTTPYSAEQERVGRKILSTEDYYEILGVRRDDNEECFKKAYKRLALQLHPDKNSAPSAEEAFKKVSKAFQCLTDPEKKRLYDQYGHEEEDVQHGVSRQYEQGFMTPEELFQAFFGVDITGGTGIYRARTFRRPVRRPQQVNENQQRLYGLVQLILVLLLLAITFFSNFFPSPQRRPYSFNRSADFPLQRLSRRSSVVYFVPTDFTRTIASQESLVSLEDKVELEYYTRRCEQEEYEILRRLQVAHYYNNLDEDEAGSQLRRMERPHCDKLQNLRFLLEYS